MKVFLGGTVNGSKWRDIVKEKLIIDYFDPVVDEWNDAAYERELSERRYCDYVLYVLTPRMTGFYAIAEVTDDSFQRPDRTIYCYLPDDDGEKFTAEQTAEFEMLGRVVKENGGKWLANLDEIIAFLNSSQKQASSDETYYDAFMSFGRQESYGFAHSIANRLSDLNYSVFIDLDDIPIIIDNEEYIFANILKSDNFIYVISSNSVRSEYCKKELDFAIKNKKRIIPIGQNVVAHNLKDLDSIVAKKKIIEFKHGMDVGEIIPSITEVLEFDKSYVHKHTKYLFQARNWRFNGESQADLLIGAERKNAINWLESPSQGLQPSNEHNAFINASKNVSWLMLPLLWLNKKTSSFTGQKWFDKFTLIISLGNPIALSNQLFVLLYSDNPARFEGVSVSMWSLFILLQFTSMFIGIKTKNLGLFISMVLSIIVCSIVIALVISNT